MACLTHPFRGRLGSFGDLSLSEYSGFCPSYARFTWSYIRLKAYTKRDTCWSTWFTLRIMKERSVLAHSECILIVTIMLSNCSPFTGPTAAAYSWWWWGPPQDSWGWYCSWSPGRILGWQAMLMSHITLVIPFTLKHTVQRDLPSVEDASGDLSNRWGCPSGTDVALIPSCESRPSFLCLCL